MPYAELLKGRISIANQVYLVTTVTHQRRPLFLDLQLGRLVVGCMRELEAKQLARSLAFVVMPDHVHWLLQLGQQQALSKLIQLFKGRSARHINLARQDHGQLWQHGFHERAVRSEESLVEAARYVIMNPVRAGLVASAGEYSLWDTV